MPIKIDAEQTIPMPTMMLDRKRMKTSIRKLVYGLYWFHTGDILPQTTEIRYDYINPAGGPAHFEYQHNRDIYGQTSMGVYNNPEIMKTFFYTAAVSDIRALFYFFFYKQNIFIASVHL